MFSSAEMFPSLSFWNIRNISMNISIEKKLNSHGIKSIKKDKLELNWRPKSKTFKMTGSFGLQVGNIVFPSSSMIFSSSKPWKFFIGRFIVPNFSRKSLFSEKFRNFLIKMSILYSKWIQKSVQFRSVRLCTELNKK